MCQKMCDLMAQYGGNLIIRVRGFEDPVIYSHDPFRLDEHYTMSRVFIRGRKACKVFAGDADQHVCIFISQ
ncbi:MAG: hypothetical protein Q9198_006730 [Flavoplaca austrocitrina]